MEEYAGLNLRLPRDVFEQLIVQSRRALRPPRDHAHYLLREALGLTNGQSQQVPEQKHNRAAIGSEAQRDAIAV